jgi:hypothetical protein
MRRPARSGRLLDELAGNGRATGRAEWSRRPDSTVVHEEKAKKEREPTATHFRAEAKAYRDWIAALKTRKQMS